MNTELIAFYKGEAPYLTSRSGMGCFITNIMEWSPMRLDATHDFVQWLFPLKEPSDYNGQAPLLDDETIEVFKNDTAIRLNAEAAFSKFCAFLCLTPVHAPDGIKVEANEKDMHWIDPYNHNYKRLTRMIASLRFMGLEEHAQALFQCLYNVFQLHGKTIGAETMAFWEKAAKTPLAELKLKG